MVGCCRVATGGWFVGRVKHKMLRTNVFSPFFLLFLSNMVYMRLCGSNLRDFCLNYEYSIGLTRVWGDSNTQAIFLGYVRVDPYLLCFLFNNSANFPDLATVKMSLYLLKCVCNFYQFFRHAIRLNRIYFFIFIIIS